MDGYESASIIRNKLNIKVLPIIAMTAGAPDSEVQHCLEIGMNDYVTKPVGPARLYRALEKWIKTRQPASQLIPSARVSQGIPTAGLPERFPGLTWNRP